MFGNPKIATHTRAPSAFVRWVSGRLCVVSVQQKQAEYEKRRTHTRFRREGPGLHQKEARMSSTEIVHGSSNPTAPVTFSQKDHSATYAAHAEQQPGATAAASTVVGAANPTAPAAPHDKRFTTAYGMVVWPSLPGLSSSSSSSTSAPVAAAGTTTRPESAYLVHHHQSTVAAAVAAPRTAQTLMPGTMAMLAEQPNGIGSGESVVGSCKVVCCLCKHVHHVFVLDSNGGHCAHHNISRTECVRAYNKLRTKFLACS